MIVPTTKDELAKTLDHTLLKPDATESDIRKLCTEALEYHFASVCVHPSNVPLAAEILRGSDVKVCAVIGFPLGATLSQVKAFEALEAVDAGAEEVDMVMNIGAMKSGNYDKVASDIQAVVHAVKVYEVPIVVKVIIETCYLTDQEKVEACKIIARSAADFAKTSTGFGPKGATIQDVELMRNTLGIGFGIKAAGGIRTYEDAMAMIKAGASRIGTSNGVAIVEGFKQ
jgi:deoxyribose-phosphate aldolase